jgi:hypothetical protein
LPLEDELLAAASTVWAETSIDLAEEERDQAEDEGVEDDCFGECETKPLD